MEQKALFLIFLAHYQYENCIFARFLERKYKIIIFI